MSFQHLITQKKNTSIDLCDTEALWLDIAYVCDFDLIHANNFEIILGIVKNVVSSAVQYL